jgi:hypothetical protein
MFTTKRTLRETRENETIRQTHNVELCHGNNQLHSNYIPLPNCNVDNIAAYKQQINAILLQNQKYRTGYEPQSSKWKLEYGYESRPMLDRLETREQKNICLKKRNIIGDCVLAAREKFPHNITNPLQNHMEYENDTLLAINWEHSIFHFDKEYSVWTTVNVTIYYDINKKIFFINVSKLKGMKCVNEDIISYITEQLPHIEAAVAPIV